MNGDEIDQIRERCRQMIEHLGFQVHYSVSSRQTPLDTIYRVSMDIAESDSEKRNKIKVEATSVEALFVELDAVEKQVTQFNEVERQPNIESDK